MGGKNENGKFTTPKFLFTFTFHSRSDYHSLSHSSACVFDDNHLKDFPISPKKHIADSQEMALHLVVVLLFYVHGKHLRSCRDGQLT